MTEFWDEVRDLFQATAERRPEERRELLARADRAVRLEVESLLAAHDEKTDFLERSVWELIDEQPERLAGTLIGPYRVERPLGHGGMGTVLLATRDTDEFSQRVAIKLVRGGEALVQRFRNERQILASLEHPNVARLFDGGTTADGVPYFVMEYVDGVPIDDFARDLPVAGKLRLFLQLCDAVQYAHRSLVIHRDLKPANVMVTPEGVVKLLDFGIATLQRETTHLQGTSTRVMTPQYASPEQILGHAVTTASDVYSLGVLLYELLTGRGPFDANRTAETEPAHPRALAGDLETIVRKAMEAQPARRYSSAEALAEDVRRYLSGHPIAARPPTFTYRATKFVRRNKLAVTAGVIVAVVTAVAFAATLHQKRIAERRFDEVRSLARAVVFELHDAIAPLPGSTPARELLVRRALGYLDRLGAEAESNDALRLELAGAYLKIGDVQGLPYAPNLGDTKGALGSYQKALAHSAAVESADGNSLLADAHDRIGIVEQRALLWTSALGHHEAARVLRERQPQTAQRDLALARTWIGIADCRYIGKLGHPRAAYETALSLLAALPPAGAHARERLRELGRAHQRLGGYHTGSLEHDLPRALMHHEAALQALRERARLDPGDAVAHRNFADQYVMIATAHNMAGNGEGAFAAATRGLDMLRELAAADPKNVEAQHDLAFAHSEQGRALAHLERFGEAEAAFERAEAIHDRLSADDPLNAEDRRDLTRVRRMLESVRKRTAPN